jgi:hypothetical protein
MDHLGVQYNLVTSCSTAVSSNHTEQMVVILTILHGAAATSTIEAYPKTMSTVIHQHTAFLFSRAHNVIQPDILPTTVTTMMRDLPIRTQC